jgi:RNA polymerase sigma factor (sigma-70 family)
MAAAREILPERFGKLLRRISAQTCRQYRMRDQERDDVVSETYQLLFNPNIVRFDPQRGNPSRYVRGLVQNAARKTLTQLGGRKRKGQTCRVSDGMAEGAMEFGGDSGYRHATKPSQAGAETELRDMVDYVMRKAPPHLRPALKLCYWDDRSIQSIAKELGVSRFSLGRELRSFLGQMQAELTGD